MILYMFSFYKNADIQITDKISAIGYKLDKKKIDVLIDSIYKPLLQVLFISVL